MAASSHDPFSGSGTGLTASKAGSSKSQLARRREKSRRFQPGLWKAAEEFAAAASGKNGMP